MKHLILSKSGVFFDFDKNKIRGTLHLLNKRYLFFVLYTAVFL